MKQSLQLKLHQQLTLTPQLQQSIRLLQLSTLELSQEISQMLQDNPLLERLDGEDRFDSPAGESPAEESRSEESRSERDEVYEEMAWGDRAVTPSHGTGSDDDEEHDYQQADASQTNLHQHLCNQLSLTPLALATGSWSACSSRPWTRMATSAPAWRNSSNCSRWRWRSISRSSAPR
jgi:RNA polymerase sigma-54 factor